MKSPNQIAIEELLKTWDARSRDALPSDAMLINKHIRELREAVATPPAQGSIDADGLPPLPVFPVRSNGFMREAVYKSDADAAILADRAARQSAALGEVHKELRSQMAYIAAYSLEELGTLKRDQLQGRCMAIIERARGAIKAAPDPSAPVQSAAPEGQCTLKLPYRCVSWEGSLHIFDRDNEPLFMYADETRGIAKEVVARLNATCTCPSGDGSLRWPCPAHPPAPSEPVPQGVPEIEHSREMAGYTVACKYGHYEREAFKLVDEMFAAFSAPTATSGGEAVHFVQHPGNKPCNEWTEVAAKRFQSFADNGFVTRTLYLAPPSLPATDAPACPEIQKAFITLESNGGEGRNIVLKFNQRDDAYAVHHFLLTSGGKEYNGPVTDAASVLCRDLVKLWDSECAANGEADTYNEEMSRIESAIRALISKEEGE